MHLESKIVNPPQGLENAPSVAAGNTSSLPNTGIVDPATVDRAYFVM